MEKAMGRYEKERNAETLPMYKFTVQTGSYEPMSLQQEVLYTALEKKPAEVKRFFGMIAGSFPVKEYFSATNLVRIMGAGGVSKVLLGGRKSTRAEKVDATNVEAG